MKFILLMTAVFGLSACSLLGDNGVESAPYTLIERDDTNKIEIRNYDSMILVSTSTQDDGRMGRLDVYLDILLVITKVRQRLQ